MIPETLITNPPVDVAEAEFHRLLGYPRGYELGERPHELAGEARRWFATYGSPWIYWREIAIETESDVLRLDGTLFQSRHLLDHLRQAECRRAIVAIACAGRAAEEHAADLWRQGKPDEYFFLETFGSAVVEHLVASLNGRICAAAEEDRLVAIPHYSPGYSGWDVAEQPQLFALITRGLSRPLPEPFEVLSSGMPCPKKSLLAVIGLSPRANEITAGAARTPCEGCSFGPCRYRRAPYRYALAKVNGHAAAASAVPPLTRDARYTVGTRALEKWARERVELRPLDDGRIEARFRFDGTTCANMGRPLAFDYVVTLAAPRDGFRILAADCTPAPGDTGHTQMCAYLEDATTLMRAIATEKPLLGRPLDDILTWQREPRSTGCHCEAQSRAHKWGLALETIHFALVHHHSAIEPASRAAAATSLPP